MSSPSDVSPGLSIFLEWTDIRQIARLLVRRRNREILPCPYFEWFSYILYDLMLSVDFCSAVPGRWQPQLGRSPGRLAPAAPNHSTTHQICSVIVYTHSHRSTTMHATKVRKVAQLVGGLIQYDFCISITEILAGRRQPRVGVGDAVCVCCGICVQSVGRLIVRRDGHNPGDPRPHGNIMRGERAHGGDTSCVRNMGLP